MPFVTALALFCAGGVSAVQQNQQQFFPPTFSKKTYNIKDENWLEYTTTVTYLGPDVVGSVECANPCKGNKHTLHSECDASCDGACTAIHKYEFRPDKKCRPGGDLKDGGGKMGLPDITFSIVRVVGNDIDEMVKGTEKKYDLKHWDKDPCSESLRLQKGDRFKVSITFQFLRNDQGPNNTKILVKGPSGTWDYGTVTVPVGDLTEPKVYVKCKCSIVEGDQKGSGVWIDKGGTPVFATSKIIDDMGVKVECESMNSCTFTCTNTTAEETTVTIGAGTVFESGDPGVQNEVCCEDVSFKCPLFSTVTVPFRASVGPPDPLAYLSGSATARAACLNMLRHEPGSGDKFTFQMPSDGALATLASKVAAERFRGPWDQVRFWILTDHASRDDMGKVLLPRPTAGMYLRSLYEVGVWTGTDLTGPEFKACLEPGLAIGASASQEATDWFVDTWVRKDSKTLANWLTKNVGALTTECFGPDTGKSEAEHASDLFNALCASGDPDLVEAAATLLLKGVPESKRKLVADTNGLTGLMAMLMSTDGKSAARAMDVAEAYRDPSIKPSLINVNDSHIEVLKERASRLYKEMTLFGQFWH